MFILEYMGFKRFSPSVPFNVNRRFYIIKIEKDIIYISMITENNYLYFIKIYFTSEDWLIKYYKVDKIFEDNFHKLLFIKENIFLLGYNSNRNPPL